MEASNIKTGFAWKPEDQTETKRVELLISKAEGIYQDHFDNEDQQLHESQKLSTYNLEQWNPDGGIFCLCVSLEPGVYHFIFRVDSGSKQELRISKYYNQTFLGNGRAVNYIELKSTNSSQKVGNVKARKRLRLQESLSHSVGRGKSESWSNESGGSHEANNSPHKSCTLL